MSRRRAKARPPQDVHWALPQGWIACGKAQGRRIRSSSARDDVTCPKCRATKAWGAA